MNYRTLQQILSQAFSDALQHGGQHSIGEPWARAATSDDRRDFVRMQLGGDWIAYQRVVDPNGQRSHPWTEITDTTELQIMTQLATVTAVGP